MKSKEKIREEAQARQTRSNARPNKVLTEPTMKSPKGEEQTALRSREQVLPTAQF